MDIKKQKSEKKNNKWLKISAFSATVVIVYLIFTMGSGSYSVERSAVALSSVQQGDLTVSISGFGIVRSESTVLLTSPTETKVKEILIRPGIEVKPDQVIVRLENPDLKDRVDEASQLLSEAKANLRKVRVDRKLALLTEEDNLIQSQLEYESAKIRQEAEQDLIGKGVISKLSYIESVAKVKQLEQKINSSEKRKDVLAAIHSELVTIAEDQVQLRESQFKSAKEKLDGLEVKAGFEGMLQKLDVEVGQSLVTGQNIASVGSTNALIAQIKIPQRQAAKISLGLVANIDNGRDVMPGTVVRIDPVVQDSSVIIDVSMPGNLPESFRPFQNVEGRIVIDELQNTLFIERPVNVHELSSGHLFQMDEDGTYANKVEIEYGHYSGRYIELRSGARIGQQFIVSDMNSMLEQDDIKKIRIR